MAYAVQKRLNQLSCCFGMGSGVHRPINRAALDGRAHWRHVANAIERLCAAAMSGSATRVVDAACSQITLGNVVSSCSHER